jgi:hypothetical protein
MACFPPFRPNRPLSAPCGGGDVDKKKTYRSKCVDILPKDINFAPDLKKAYGKG